ncbi:MAG: hypothetical protein IH851_05125 [Armatimonadetes bacterium]|nr:hypothetical protein [Armatimonadota bacterium]
MKISAKFAVVLAAIAIFGAAYTAPIQQHKLKMRIAVAPLEYRESYFDGRFQVPVEFRNAIYEKLVKKLIDTGRFVVLEREAYDELVREQQIKEEATGESRRGKIVWAQALIKGNVTDFILRRRGTGVSVSIPRFGRIGSTFTEAKMTVNLRIFDVDTSEVLAMDEASGHATSTSFSWSGGIGSIFATWSAFDSSPLGKATTKAIDQAVEKIVKRLQKMPWSAKVADWDHESGEIYINAGAGMGVRPGDRFDISRVIRVIRDPETGEVLGKREATIGVIEVSEVEEKFSVAKVISGDGFEVGDIVREARARGW